jgi:hypothetical protein
MSNAGLDILAHPEAVEERAAEAAEIRDIQERLIQLRRKDVSKK